MITKGKPHRFEKLSAIFRLEEYEQYRYRQVRNYCEKKTKTNSINQIIQVFLKTYKRINAE